MRDRATTDLLLALDGATPGEAYVLDGALVTTRDGRLDAPGAWPRVLEGALLVHPGEVLSRWSS